MMDGGREGDNVVMLRHHVNDNVTDRAPRPVPNRRPINLSSPQTI